MLVRQSAARGELPLGAGAVKQINFGLATRTLNQSRSDGVTLTVRTHTSENDRMPIMRRIHIIGLGAMVLSLSLASPARSQFVPDGWSAFQQTAAADLIVIGKVTDIEPQSVLAERTKGADKVDHLVATIRIEENLLGAKGLTHLRVAFVPGLPPPPPTNPAQKRYL
jgi:hypothetical protein